MRLYFSHRTLQRVEFVPDRAKEANPNSIASGDRHGQGDFHWREFAKAFAVIVLLCKASEGQRPKVKGKGHKVGDKRAKSPSAVSTFLNEFQKHGNAFDGLFSPHHLSQCFFSSGRSVAGSEERRVGLETNWLTKECIEVLVPSGSTFKHIEKATELEILARKIEDQHRPWSRSVVELEELGFDLTDGLANPTGEVQNTPVPAKGLKKPSQAPIVPNPVRDSGPPRKSKPYRSSASHQEGSGWLRPDVKRFLADKFSSARSIDSAVILHRGPRREGKDYWLPEEVVLEVDQRYVEFPATEPFASIIKDWERQQTLRSLRGVKYHVADMSYRGPEHSEILRLRTRPILYRLMKPIQDVLMESFTVVNAFEHERWGSLRRQYFPKLLSQSAPPEYNALHFACSAVTKDDFLLLFKRKDAMGYFPAQWSASFEEGLNFPGEKHEVFDTCKPDTNVHQALNRALKEELGLSEEECDQTKKFILAAGFEFSNFNANLFALVQLPLAAEAVFRKDEIKSHIEHGSFACCPFKLDALRPVLAANPGLPKELDPRDGPQPVLEEWVWHSTSRMRIFLSLAHRFGANEVLAAVAKLS